MKAVTVMSMFAAGLSMVSFVPQAWAIIVQNVICLVWSSFILCMKMLPQDRKEVVADAVVAVMPEVLVGHDEGRGS